MHKNVNEENISKINFPQKQIKYKFLQFFPLRTSCVPKYIPIDTGSVAQLLCTDNMKYKYTQNTTHYKNEVWNKYFNIDPKYFKINNHTFSGEIRTDGVSVSILFICNKMLEKKIMNNRKNKLYEVFIESNKCENYVQSWKKKTGKKIVY